MVRYFHTYNRCVAALREQLPDLYEDMPDRPVPKPSGTGDFEGRGYIGRGHVESLARDIEYILEVRSHINLQAQEAPAAHERCVFLSHGHAPDWLEVQAFIEKDVTIPTLELSQKPNRGRTVLQKLAEESDRCSYAVVVMTGDDAFGSGPARARENVMQEIGFFQGKFGLENVCILYEEGTSIPSNIRGLVYIPYPKGLVTAAFGVLARELRAAFD